MIQNQIKRSLGGEQRENVQPLTKKLHARDGGKRTDYGRISQIRSKLRSY